MNLVEFTEYLIKSITKNPDMVKVSSFDSDEGVLLLEIIVDPDDMGVVIGRNGKNATAIRTLVQAHAYLNDNKKVKINIDSF